MSETAGEKTFAPSEKRLRDAANKGDVLRSKDLGTAAVMLVGAGWLAFGGPWLLGDMSSLLRESFNFDHGELTDFRPGRMLMQGLAASLPPILALAVPVIHGSGDFAIAVRRVMLEHDFDCLAVPAISNTWIRP